MAQEQGAPFKIVFLGTPEFAATILQGLLNWPRGEVVAVYTQPDRPCGRGQVCKPSAVKELALDKGLPIYQPEHFKNPDDLNTLQALRPDILVVAAFGLILPQAVLDVAPLGAVNVHASLLPKYRGAAPIQRVILDGEHVTGITIMQLVKEMDAGPILLQRALGIDIHDTAQKLHDELAQLGALLLVQTLDNIKQGKMVRIEQDHDQATYAPKLTKEEGLINWNRPAWTVHNQIRGLFPWPGTFFEWQDSKGKALRLQVFPGKPGRDLTHGEKPGTILGKVDDSIAIACQDKVYLTPQIKPAGKKAMDAEAFACGYLSRCQEELN